VAVLGASSYLFAIAVRSQALVHFVGAHVDAFELFGAVPDIVVPDNLRSGVTKAHCCEPDINATYQEMAEQYGLAVIPTRPAKPRDKAKVEAEVLLAERWILARLRHRRFFSLAEANVVIRELVREINDRPFKNIRFETEPVRGARPPGHGPAPRAPLPVRRLAPREEGQHRLPRRRRRALLLGSNRLVGQRVDIRVSALTVEVFFRHRRVASHLRRWKRGGHTTDPDHTNIQNL
jgi:hypothetical protein